MKKIRIQYSDGAIFCQKIIKNILLTEYAVEEVNANPDLLIYSLYGSQHKSITSKKLLIVGENSFPNFNECDYAISPHNIFLENRHCRIPFYVFNKEYQLLCKNVFYESGDLFNRQFCGAMISNNSNSDPFRANFLMKLHQRKKICSVGKALNTTGHLMQDRPLFAENLDTKFTNPAKIFFASQFKFNLALENSSVNGYCTEKITDAFIAKSIPIYWGDKNIYSEFKKGSFININDFKNIDEAIDFILKVDSDKDLYLSMLNNFEILNKKYLSILKDFLINCIEGDIFEHKYGNLYYQNL